MIYIGRKSLNRRGRRMSEAYRLGYILGRISALIDMAIWHLEVGMYADALQDLRKAQELIAQAYT